MLDMPCQVDHLFISHQMNYLLITNLMNSQQSPSALVKRVAGSAEVQVAFCYRSKEAKMWLNFTTTIFLLMWGGQYLVVRAKGWRARLPRFYSQL